VLFSVPYVRTVERTRNDPEPTAAYCASQELFAETLRVY